jgi:hypothetical protein
MFYIHREEDLILSNFQLLQLDLQIHHNPSKLFCVYPRPKSIVYMKKANGPEYATED